MVSPEFIEEKPINISDLKEIIDSIVKRDTELNFRTNKTKEFLEHFQPTLGKDKIDELQKKLGNLKLTRLKEEHIIQISNFLPTTLLDLKIVLMAYPLSLPKKDQEAIIKTVKEFTA